MSEYFNPEQLEELTEKASTIRLRTEEITWSYITHEFSNETAKEYALHGVARRFKFLEIAISEIYDLLPPSQTGIPQKNVIDKVMVHVQSLVINVYGLLENLAFVWAYEKSVKKSNGQAFSNYEIGFTKTKFKKLLPKQIIDNLTASAEWIENLESYRHSLAHRIPLYIPPFSIDPKNLDRSNELEADAHKALKAHKFDEYEILKREQKSYCFFRPWITHSYSENARPVVFHSQILADFATVELLAQLVISELKNRL